MNISIEKNTHQPGTGILLTNIGSPDQPTPFHVKRYLAAFLSDPRVVSLPSFLWKPLLHAFILPKRAINSAKLYQKIWTKDGSPLVVYSKRIAEQLASRLHLPVVLGTHYGNPSIQEALAVLRQHRIKKLIVLPLYPQFSFTTTSAALDQISANLKQWDTAPEVNVIENYATEPDYISAICQSIEIHQPKHLVISFHGIPQKYIDRGDPYYEQCVATTERIIDRLKWPREKFSLTFQSRLGPTTWLRPYTSEVLEALPKQGTKDIHVICPGFAVDCLETLEEISIRGREQFLQAGGERFQYIAALNDTSVHLDCLEKLLLKN